MLLSKRNDLLNLALVGGLLLFLAGCGFRPLHLRTGPQSVESLSQIHVRTIADRIGQKLHNLLLERLNPRGEPVRPTYELGITVRRSIERLAVQKSAIATRANLRVSVTFNLLNSKTQDVLLTGNKLVVAGYDIMSSDYATLIAEKDAENRALGELADELRTQLAVYFNRASQ